MAQQGHNDACRETELELGAIANLSSPPVNKLREKLLL